MIKEKDGIDFQTLAPYFPTGVKLLHDPILNQGMAFTDEERDALHLRGLLPFQVMNQEAQAQQVLENFRKKPTDLEKYIYMIGLEDRNENLFYRAVMDNLEEMMPIIYTPTVGQACVEYGHIFRRPRGLFINATDQGRVFDILENWPYRDVRVIVVTDGERILGLGDQGACGMGIPVGKLSLYTACAGIDPATTLPVMLDVGTNNEGNLDDPLYIGMPIHRIRGERYDELIEEFLTAVQIRFPNALVQFEDFATSNAFRLLNQYRNRFRVFNDDIQGTAGVTLAGLMSAMKLIQKPLKDQVLLFLGAGEAGIGIADLIVAAMELEGIPRDEAMRRCWFVDSRGLVTSDRADLQPHKVPYAQPHPPVADFLDAVQQLRPTAIIGVSGQPRTFTQPVVEAMAEINDRPIIFALSNPTSKSECTAEQAYGWTQGRAIFASGSPFPKVELAGQTFIPSQGNNSYVFPGVGLGIVVSGARHVTDEMFLAAAQALVDQVSDEDLAQGRLYPPLTSDRIRTLSAHIAAAVARVAYERGLAVFPEPDDLLAHVEESMYHPAYPVLA